MIVRELVAKFGVAFDKQDADKFDDRIRASKKSAEQAVAAVKAEAEAARDAFDAEAKGRKRAAEAKARAAKESLAQTQRQVEAEIRGLKKAEGETDASFKARARAAKDAARERIRAAREVAKAEEDAARKIKESIAEETRASANSYRKRIDDAQHAARARIEAEHDVVAAERKAESERTERFAKGRERIKSFMSGVADVTKRAVQLGSAGAVAIGAGAIVATDRKQQQLVGLETATGSMETAQRERARLKTFGRNSGIGGNDTIEAYIRLKNLGLKNDDRTIGNLSNIAAGSKGKTNNDIIEAVADAATGEFERLKEFGFKAKQSGDEVAITFKGITTTIKRDASTITEYLSAIGENDFAGAVGRKSKTLSGEFSTLKESAGDFLVEVGENGLGKAINEVVKKLDTTTRSGKSLAATLGESLARIVRQLFDLLMQGLPIFTSLIELVLKIVEAVGGPGGLVALLVAGKGAMVAMNLAMSAMSAQGTSAAGALKSIAGAAGIASAALAAAALIVAHFEKKIADLKQETRLQREQVDGKLGETLAVADESGLSYFIDAKQKNIEMHKRAIAKKKAQLIGRGIGGKEGYTEIDQDGKFATKLKSDIATLEENIAYEESQLNSAKAEDARRTNAAGGGTSGSSRAKQAGMLDEVEDDGFGPATGEVGFGGVRTERFKETEAQFKARKIKNLVGRRGDKYGANDIAKKEAVDAYNKAVEKGANPARAVKVAEDLLKKSVNYKKPKGKKGKKKIGELDEEAFAAFEADARKRAVGYGATDAGVNEALDAFRETMIYGGGNVAAAKKAGLDKLRKKSGLAGKDGLTITDMLDRDFGNGTGMPGGSPAARGGGGLGTTINRYDSTFAPNVDITIPIAQAEGEDMVGLAERIRDEVDDRMRDTFNQGYQHFSPRGS